MGGQWARVVLAAAMVLTINASGMRHDVAGATMTRPVMAQELPVAAGNSAVIQFVCCAYTPAEVIIYPGYTVEWSGNFTFHPLVSEDGLWATVNTGTQFTHTFSVTGTFAFYCQAHGGPGGVGMAGRVIVQDYPFKVYLPLALR